MAISIRLGIDGLDWVAVADVIARAPLRKREPEEVRRASEGSFVVCTAWDGEKLVGFGRAISDGEYQSAIYDMAILPEYQGQGVGRQILTALLDRLPSGNVLLYAAPGKEGFYRKHGFDLMRTGMARFVDPEGMRQRGYIY